MRDERSRELFREAQQYLPGGVNSPVRAFKAVGGTPPFIVRGSGSKIYDADGHEYIDYVNSWGPLILGHAHPAVIEAVKKAAELGTSFGAPSEQETLLAKIINKAMPSMEKLRFVNSGTEATMSALRLARAYTGRDKVIKFSGGYHGHSDGLLTKAGSGLATLGIPDSPGVPAACANLTLTVPYNDIEAAGQLFQQFPEDIAAVIVEPVAANMGVVLPSSGLLESLRALTLRYGALLIFDEVITGFRVAYGGAQAMFGITPDLTCLGKIIGGGLPVGAYGGRREIMQMVAPEGQVYQAGTLSGNPLAMAAGIETLKQLEKPGMYFVLEAKTAKIAEGVKLAAKTAGIDVCISSTVSLLTLFFSGIPIVSYETAHKADTVMFSRFFRYLLENGIYWPPSQFEAAFISLSHNDDDIQRTIEVVDGAFREIKER